MFKNAWAYVTRKKLKSVILFGVILAMTSLSLISLSIKEATGRAAKETFQNITNSFTMEINRQVNQGTPRGGGNVKGEDIKQIEGAEGIDGYVKRINSVADLLDHDLVQTPETEASQSPERAKNFGRAVMLTGVNESAKETKFVSGAFTLVEGRPLERKDRHQILMHQDLARKNHLKVGDKLTLRSNRFDADNEKGADVTVEVTIKGLFDGHNSGGVSAAQELYENNLVTDIHTAAEVYGNDEKSAVYQDATFFVKGNRDLDQVMRSLEKLDIDWQSYQLIKSSSNYPALQQSISGIYGLADQLFYGALLFAGLVIALLLFLWTNARKKEVAVLLALGREKGRIFGQWLLELSLVSLPAYLAAYFLSGALGNAMGQRILQQVTGQVARQMARQSASTGMGGGAEVDGFHKTLTALEVHLNGAIVGQVLVFMSLVLLIALLIASFKMAQKNPKDLLTDQQ